MATEILVNIGSGNGVLPDGTKSHYVNQCWLIISKVDLVASSMRLVASSMRRKSFLVTTNKLQIWSVWIVLVCICLECNLLEIKLPTYLKSSDIHIRTISQEIPQPSITKICLKITCLKFHSNFPGANELTFYGLSALFVNCLQNRYEAHACKMIQVMSHERHGVSCHRQLDCLHSLLMITKNT